MTNWNNPQLTSTYTNFVTEVKDRDTDLATMFRDISGLSNTPTNAIRWDNTANRWKLWNGSAWVELTNTYALTGLSTTGNAAIGGNVTATDITASDEMQAVRFTVTGSTEPANGMYRPSSNTLGFTTSSSRRLTIDSSGNIGINDTSPSQRLDVNGSARISNGTTSSTVLEIGAGATGNRNAFIDLTGDTTYSDYGLRFIRNGGANSNSEIIHRGTGNLLIEANEAGDIRLLTASTSRMTVDSGGNIGINTTSPSTLLHINAGGAGSQARIRLQNSEGSAYLGVDADQLRIDADTHLFRTESGTERARLNSTGLAIGATSFSHKLHVQGTARVTGAITASGGVAGNVTGNVTGNVSGNATTATRLQTARTIGGVSFNGSANINLPGVNTAGTQNTSGTAGGLSGNPSVSVTNVTASGKIQPSTGSGTSDGIIWAANPGGGSGDEASIKYYVESGENTKLKISNGNDTDDDIEVSAKTVTVGQSAGTVNILGSLLLGGSPLASSSFTKFTFAAGSGTGSTRTHTWTKSDYSGSTAIVLIWGGGGGGGRNSSLGGGGGAGSNCQLGLFPLSDLGATETITIGQGGAGRSSNGNGNTGTNSTFGSLLTSYGGLGGDDNESKFAQGSTPFGTGSISTEPTRDLFGNSILAGGFGALFGTDFPGGNAVFGGAGGGGCDRFNAGGAGGTSIIGGNGGQGQGDSNGDDGQTPGGGGGGTEDNTSGSGGDGECWVIIV